MKRIILSFLFLALLVQIIGQEGKRIVILHTNDLHSRLNGFSPESQYSPLTEGNDNTRGGFSRISTILSNEAGKDNETTLILDAGDFLMGTLFHALEERTGFQLKLMKKMGYDVVSIGNHEFDFGPQTLAQTIIQSKKSGEIPEILLGNAVFDEKDPNDDTIENLFASNGLLSWNSLKAWMILTMMGYLILTKNIQFLSGPFFQSVNSRTDITRLISYNYQLLNGLSIFSLSLLFDTENPIS